MIFHDPINKIHLAGLLAAADIGMQILTNVPAFYYGTSPNKFFDYIASGLPVLNNYPGWIAELITQHQCGIAVPPNNPKVFADALEHAADNHHILQAMRTNSLVLAQKQFDRSQLADQWVDCLEKTIIC